MFKDKIILVTGGTGFLGSHLVDALDKCEPQEIVIPRSKTSDLREKDNCLSATDGVDFVFHLAANVGGIGYNQSNSSSLFYDNAIMGIQMMEASKINKVKKFINLCTVCVYPSETPVPFKPENIWNGYPEETNAAYGIAKKILLVQSKAYRKDYGFNSINLMLTNLYGPRDNFNDYSSHVIPALIKKFLSKLPKIEIWGSGEASRDFMYVSNACEAIIGVAQGYNSSEPINVGTGRCARIKDIVKYLKYYTNYEGKIVWNKDKPDGQMNRRLDVKPLYNIKYVSYLDLYEGLRRTVDWWRKENGV